MDAVTSSTFAGAIADHLSRKRTIGVEAIICGVGRRRRELPDAYYGTIDRTVYAFSL